jgi:hypothetical protein
MRLFIWRGPVREGHYQDGDIVEILDDTSDGGSMVKDSPIFEQVVLPDEDRLSLRVLDFQTVGERLPASMLKIKRKNFRESEMDLLDDALHLNSRRRFWWDGTAIRNKRYAV